MDAKSRPTQEPSENRVLPKWRRQLDRWRLTPEGASAPNSAEAFARYLWPEGQPRRRKPPKSGAGRKPIWPLSRFLALFPAGEYHTRAAWIGAAILHGCTKPTAIRLWKSAKGLGAFDWGPIKIEGAKRGLTFALIPGQVETINAKWRASLDEKRAAKAAPASAPDAPAEVRGRPARWTEADLLEVLGDRRLTCAQWLAETLLASKMWASTFYRLRKRLEISGRISRDADGTYSAVSQPALVEEVIE